MKMTEGLHRALAVVRDRTRALPKTKSAGGRYNYTPLPEIIDYLRPVLEEAELVVVQQCTTDPTSGAAGVTTSVFSKDGGELSSTIYAPLLGTNDKVPMSPIQRVGSEITYLRRYALCSVLNLASDEDSDGYTLGDAPSVEKAKADDAKAKEREKKVAKLKEDLVKLGYTEDADRVDGATPDELNALWKKAHPY